MKEIHTRPQWGLCSPASGTWLTCSVKYPSSISADSGQEFEPQIWEFVCTCDKTFPFSISSLTNPEEEEKTCQTDLRSIGFSHSETEYTEQELWQQII